MGNGRERTEDHKQVSSVFPFVERHFTKIEAASVNLKIEIVSILEKIDDYARVTTLLTNFSVKEQMQVANPSMVVTSTAKMVFTPALS